MKRIITFIFSVLSVIHVWAIEVISDPDTTINLDQVVVTATKLETFKTHIPLSMSVINRQEIETSSESALLPVLSSHVPGLFVTERGITGYGLSTGAAGTVNIRGVGQSNRVLMMFDGQPQWAGLFGHALPDTYVASDVERVEVIRGPGSLLYGSNAMGGVVNVITRKHQQQGRLTQARVLYGSYNTRKIMVNNGYNTGGFSSFISLNHDYTDGHRDESMFRIFNGFANLGYRFNDQYKISGNISLAKILSENPGMVTRPIHDNDVDALRGTTALAFENDHDKISGAVRLYYNWGNHEINDGYYDGDSPRTYLFRSDDHNYGVLLYETFRLLEGNYFTVGLDYKNWGGHAWNANNDGSNDEMIDKSINETAGYVVLQQDLFDIVSLNAGIRYEHNSSFGNEWVPQAGLTVRPFIGNSVKVSLSKGFRSPNIREMYMFPPQNPDLKPESMMNYEVSVAQMFMEGALSFELTAFYIDGKDMIQTVPMEGRPPLNVNTGAFINKGIEAELTYRILSNLDFSTNYSYLHTDQPLLAAPKHKFFADLTFRPGRFTFDVNVQTIADLYINTATQLKENYSLLNAKASYLIGTQEKGVNLFLKGENLAGTGYSINEGFPMPKAIVLGGINISF
ncbi:MAG: TonB-dependent receptor [Tannerella sp.]|jgi:iron complex outermembrane receptor protein|nr:TonB-dependent receptor [Tannerella sp.]